MPERMCVNCAYPLAGLAAQACPECGAAVDPVDLPRWWVHPVSVANTLTLVFVPIAMFLHLVQDNVVEMLEGDWRQAPATVVGWAYLAMLAISMPVLRRVASNVRGPVSSMFKRLTLALLVISFLDATSLGGMVLGVIIDVTGWVYPSMLRGIWSDLVVLACWTWICAWFQMLGEIARGLGLFKHQRRLRWWKTAWVLPVVFILLASNWLAYFYLEVMLGGKLPLTRSDQPLPPEVEMWYRLQRYEWRGIITLETLLTATAAMLVMTAMIFRLRLCTTPRQ